MNGLETAIRNALDRADHADAAVRDRIYQSARAAVEKSLHKQVDADPAAIALQRQRAEAVIAGIERDYAQRGPRLPRTDAAMLDIAPGNLSGSPLGAGPAADGAPLAVDPGDRLGAPPVHTPAPDRAGPFTADGEPAAAPPDERQPVARAAAPPARKRRRAGFLLPLLLQLGLVAALVGGVLWWISASGGIEQAGRRMVEGGADLIATTGSGDAAPALRTGAGQFAGDWTDILSPAGMDGLRPGSAARLEAPADGAAAGAAGIIVTSSSASADGEVAVPVAIDTVAAMAGREVLVALTARAASDGPTQIYVRCAFAGGSECGRNRFEIDTQATDLLFNMTLPADAATADGTLFIHADVQGQGRGIELLSLRFRPAS